MHVMEAPRYGWLGGELRLVAHLLAHRRRVGAAKRLGDGDLIRGGAGLLARPLRLCATRLRVAGLAIVLL